jgi:hypothetical protein
MFTGNSLQRDAVLSSKQQTHKESTTGTTGGNALDAASVGARQAPHFDKLASKNVTALLGKTAYLICRVKNLGNKTVSLPRIFILFPLRNASPFALCNKVKERE